MQTSRRISLLHHPWRMTLAPSCCFAILFCLPAGPWLCAPAEATADGDAIPSAKSIVDKAIAFHGGLKALGRDLALVRSEESEMVIEGDKVELKCEWQYQPPDKRAFQATVKIGGLQLRILQGIIGEKGWIKVGPALAVDLSPEQVAGLSWEHDNHVRSVQVLAVVEDGYYMTAPRPIRIGERDAWQITFTAKKAKNSVTGFFDKVSGQVIGDEAERIVPTLDPDKTREKAVKFRVLFKSFLNVGGIKMPETMVISHDGRPVVEVLQARVRVVDKLDPKLFTKPK
jgi:hypothetical protein